MTPEKLEAIRKRNKLKRLYNESKCRLDWNRYKTQRNLTSLLRHKAVSERQTPNAKRQMQPQEIVENSQAFHALKEKHQPGLHSS